MEAVYRNHCFGIETECTGIRRDNVWKILGPEFCKSVSKYKTRKGYYNYIITDHTDRKWYVKLDSSILARRSVNGKICRVPLEEYGEYQVEFISPILEYDRDIGMLLTAIRKLKAAGAIVNKSCGIHIHLDGRKYNSHDIKNFCNIVASRTKLFDLALKAEPVRRENYCKDLDTDFLDLINKTHEVPMDKIEEAWYSKYDQEMSRDEHYHKSRYSLLNLHSFFHGHKTVELRCFNSSLDAEMVRAYVLLALGLNFIALTSKYTWNRPVEVDNPRYTMIHFLQRIGIKGPQYAKVRELLTKHLPGDPNWRQPRNRA